MLTLFFKQSLSKISYISRHSYADRFIFDDNGEYSDTLPLSADDFKKTILTEEIKMLPINEREQVFKQLIRENR